MPTPLQTFRPVAVMLSCVVLMTTACGSGSRSSAGAAGTAPSPTPSVLHVAFLDDIGPPDPDLFYATEGLMVTTSVYEGLLQYGNNSTTIVPALADLPTVSADKLTYTFKLHDGSKFHDGTPLTSSAVPFSFSRRTAINEGPAYMVAHVKSVDTPDPLTAVVHLDQPVSAFLDYLASPFGPKMVSPTAIAANAAADDHAKKWLQTHDAGSGPFALTSFTPSQKYVLTRFDGYPGKKPVFSEVDVSVEPNVTTQQLELERGQLDMVMHGLTPANVDAFAKKKGFTVHPFPSELKTVMFVNPHSGAFASPESRRALEQVIDKASITKSVFGPAGVTSTQIYPAGELPATATTSKVPYDPSVLQKLAGTLPTKKVDIGFDPTDPRNEKVAELVQISLQSAGLNATTRQIPIAQIFDLPMHLDQAPTILIQTTNPDAAHPDTWARIYMSKGGGANYLACVDPSVDKLLDAGLAATAPADVEKAYGDAGNLIVQGGCFIDIADVQDTTITRSGLTGLYHVPSIPWSVQLGALTNG